MDRNLASSLILSNSEVALRKESVDRNIRFDYFTIVEVTVALRKESVDRNIHINCNIYP